MRKLVVSSEVTKILSYNKERISALIFNIGDYDLYVSENPTEIAENGFPIRAGMCLQIREKDGDDATKELYGICPSGSVELRIWEVYRKEEKKEEVSS